MICGLHLRNICFFILPFISFEKYFETMREERKTFSSNKFVSIQSIKIIQEKEIILVRNAVSNINPVREDRAARVLVLVLNQQSATISLHFTRLAIAPGQRYDKKGSNVFILFAVDFQLWFFDL